MSLPSNPGADPGIPSWARVGAKVVYVGRMPPPAGYAHCDRTAALSVGEVYTLRAVLEDPGYPGIFGCYLKEVTNSYHPILGREYGYLIWEFRPLVTEKDDLEAHFNVYLKTDHRATRRVGEDA